MVLRSKHQKKHVKESTTEKSKQGIRSEEVKENKLLASANTERARKSFFIFLLLVRMCCVLSF